MASRVVGVDIGSTSVRAVEVLNPAKAKPTVVRYHEVPLPAGAARAGEVLEPHTVASALKRLWATGGFKSRNVVLGMGNQRVLARDLTLPMMSQLQIQESLPFQVQDMLPMPVPDALLAFYPVSEGSSESGPVVNGLLVAAVKASVLANVAALKAAGLVPVEVDLIPFALTRVQTRGMTTLSPVAVVEVGAATTNVVVTIGGVPQFVRMIPSGGDDVTRALVARAELAEDVADQAKRSLGLASPTSHPEYQQLTEIIRDVTFELLNSIRNTITYYDNTRESGQVQLIVLSGGGAQMPGFSSALSELTRVQVVGKDLFLNLTVSPKAAAAENLPVASMNVALGLALGSVA